MTEAMLETKGWGHIPLSLLLSHECPRIISKPLQGKLAKNLQWQGTNHTKALETSLRSLKDQPKGILPNSMVKRTKSSCSMKEKRSFWGSEMRPRQNWRPCSRSTLLSNSSVGRL
jgi:hypothetical protein